MAASRQRPNVIFFFTDQQRADTCGCYGQKLPTTPNLDRMAAEGTLFRNAFTCQPVCGPARACIQTGKWATEVDCWMNNMSLPDDHRTLAHRLKDFGYDTAYVGKWHLASDEEFNCRAEPVPAERRGGYVDYWMASDVLEFTSHGYDGHMFDGDGNKREFPQGRYRADAQTDFVLEYLRQRPQDNPLFLMISYIEPHHQNDHNRYEGPEGSKERWKDYEVPGDLVDTEGDWRENYPDYLGCIHALDANLGRLRDELEALGMADNTVIVFTSDHGSHFRTRNGEYKRSCHDACLKIPMVAWGPGFDAGGVVEELTSLIDVPATLVAAGGVPHPPTFRGRPLQELGSGEPPTDWPKEIFAQISEDHIGRCIRTDRWKYEIQGDYVKPKGKGWDREQPARSDRWFEAYLYDLDADPHERNNLVADPDHAEIRAELARRLSARMVAAGEPAPEILPART